MSSVPQSNKAFAADVRGLTLLLLLVATDAWSGHMALKKCPGLLASVKEFVFDHQGVTHRLTGHDIFRT